MRTRTLLISSLTAALLAGGATSAQAATLGGVTSIQSSVDAQQAGEAEAFSFSAATSGTAASISLYVDSRNRATTARVGLYTDAPGRPGTLLAQGSVASPKGAAWNTLTLPSTPIVAGRTYWLAVLGNGGSIYFRDRSSNTNCKSKASLQTTLTSLPSSWTTGATYNSCSVSAYVSGTSTSSPPPPPAPAAPTASFTFTPGSPVTGQATTFDASGSSCPATPCTYSWQDDGPDGAGGTQWPLGTGKTMSFTFSSAGDKIVRLTVTDAQARSSAAVQTIKVTANPTPSPTPDPGPTPTPDPKPTPTPTPTPTPSTCNRTATSAATLSTQFSAAVSGDTICLAGGGYGTFTAGAKSGMVTIRPQDGATASMSAQFSGASNVTLDGLTITALNFNRTVKNVTVRNSRFTGFAHIDATSMRDAAILLDANTHIDINMNSLSTPPGRVHVDAGNVAGNRSGITIRNSLFKGGTSDGIRADGDASIVIEGNEFSGIRDVDPYHADAVQFYGGQNVTVRGNYFHDQVVASSCSLGQHDGGGGHLIERNVIVGGNCYYGMYLRDDTNSIVRNNTFAYGSCMGGITCGELVIDGKTSGGSGTIFRNNIFTSLSNGGGVASQYTADHNLTRGSLPGIANLIGTPIYAGGANPTTYAGFKLAAGSPGRNAGSDGQDIGI